MLYDLQIDKAIDNQLFMRIIANILQNLIAGTGLDEQGMSLDY